MKKLNIVKVIDQWGWAYYFVDIEQQRYSRHNIIIQKYDNINLKGIDIVYIHGPNIHESLNSLYPIVRNRDIKLVGGYGGLVKHTYPYANAIVTISPETYESAKKNNQIAPVIFLPESIDTNYFVSKPNNRKNMVVGYAGSTLPLKRTYLLDKLKYPVIKKSNWGKEYFTENKSQESMKDFYNSIDVLLLLSTTECMPRVVLEAMSVGIPIIATDVGCIKYLLTSDWIVPVNPDEEIIKQVNEKLTYLNKNPEERKKIGIRNRQHVEKYFSWKVTQPIWDDFFDEVYNNNLIRLANFPNYINNLPLIQ